MKINDFNNTLNHTKTVTRLLKLRNEPVTYPEIKEDSINWTERMKTKTQILKTYLAVEATCLAVFLLLAFLPFYIAYPPVGKSILLAIPPMLFVSLSWMTGCWWAFDKERYIFLAATLGAMPLRIGIGLMWTVAVYMIPDINLTVYIFSLMVCWTLFTIPEVMMIRTMSQKLKSTAQIEPTSAV